jgi:bacterioferritin
MDAYWPGTKVIRAETPATARTVLRVAKADAARTLVIARLNEALGIAMTSALRSKARYFLALRYFSPALARLALEHANAARTHAERLRGRIAEMDDEPRPVDADGEPPQAEQPSDPGSLIALISRDLGKGNETIDRYREIAAFVVTFDDTTQALVEEIVAAEERHASALAGLLTKASAPYVC